MSNGTNNFTPPSGSRRTGRNYAAPPPLRTILDTTGGLQDLWWPFEERGTAIPFSLTSFLMRPHPSVPILVRDNDRVREAAPRPRLFVEESPPRFMGQRNMQFAAQGEESRLTQEEQKKALKKLKRKTYNPIPKRISKRLNLYDRDDGRKSYKEKEMDNDEDGKRCAICLEDFEPRLQVMLTPCNHMFHEDCIVPWVKSHGQCPVCRFALYERRRETALPINNNTANMAATDLFAADIMAIIRAINELG